MYQGQKLIWFPVFTMLAFQSFHHFRHATIRKGEVSLFNLHFTNWKLRKTQS